MIWFERYEIRKILGSGGEGQVYEAIDLHLQRRVAIKIGTSSPNFLNEIRMLQSLSLDCFPTIYDAWIQEENGIIVMEYLDGISAGELLIREGPLTMACARKWGIFLAQQLGKMHRNVPQIIYRDLKPDNIMVLADGSIRLIDLGAAAFPETAPERMRIGTAFYASPEQWRGEKSDERSDVYSLGRLLFTMLMGKQTADVQMNRQDCILPTQLQRILQKCMRDNPQERYPSMDAFLKEWREMEKHTRQAKRREKFFRFIKILLLFAAALILWIKPQMNTIWGAILMEWAVLTGFEKCLKMPKKRYVQERSVWRLEG